MYYIRYNKVMESLKGRTLEDQILFANIIHDIAYAYSFEKKEEMALDYTPKNVFAKALSIWWLNKDAEVTSLQPNGNGAVKEGVREYNKARLEQCTDQFKDSNYIMGIRYLSSMLKKNIRKQYEAEVDQFKQNSRSMTPEVKQAELIRFDKLESLITISPSIDLLYQGRKSNDSYDDDFASNQAKFNEIIEGFRFKASEHSVDDFLSLHEASAVSGELPTVNSLLARNVQGSSSSITAPRQQQPNAASYIQVAQSQSPALSGYFEVLARINSSCNCKRLGIANSLDGMLNGDRIKEDITVRELQDSINILATTLPAALSKKVPSGHQDEVELLQASIKSALENTEADRYLVIANNLAGFCEFVEESLQNGHGQKAIVR
jgi:hypothetical protein